MSATAILAAGWTISVNTGDGYVEVKGMRKFTLNPGETTEKDITTFRSAGQGEHIVSKRTKSVAFEAVYLEDESTGGRDPGQAAVEAISGLIGQDAYGQIKMVSPGDNEKEFYGTFALKDIGGGVEDETSWGFEFKRSGADL